MHAIQRVAFVAAVLAAEVVAAEGFVTGVPRDSLLFKALDECSPAAGEPPGARAFRLRHHVFCDRGTALGESQPAVQKGNNRSGIRRNVVPLTSGKRYRRRGVVLGMLRDSAPTIDVPLAAPDNNGW